MVPKLLAMPEEDTSSSSKKSSAATNHQKSPWGIGKDEYWGIPIELAG